MGKGEGRAYIQRKREGGREGGREGARGERCLFQEEREAQGKLFICRKNYDGDISAVTFKRQRTSFAEYASSFFPEGDGSRVSFPFLWERDIPRHPEKTIFKFPSPSPLRYDPVFQCQGLRLRPLGERAETRFFFSPRCKYSFTRKSAQKSMKTHMGSTGKNVGFFVK